MSVIARRIIEIKTETEYDSFNLWHDGKLMEFLDDEANFFSQLVTHYCDRISNNRPY